MNKRYKDKGWLEEKYIEESLTTYEIANLCDGSNTTIWRWVKKFNIPRRDSAPREKKVTKTCEYCGNNFEIIPSREDKCRFCSQKCQAKWKSDNQIRENHPNWKEKIQKECKNCGREFEVNPSRSDKKYCSEDCYTEWKKDHMQKEDSPAWQGGKIEKECEFCEESYRVYPNNKERARFCSRKCRDNWRAKNIHGDNHPSWKERIKKECKYCGEKFKVRPSRFYRKFCSQECFGKWRSEHIRGEDNPQWKGGCGSLFYGTNWWKQRKKVLERDNHKCQKCGVSSEEAEYGLEVHHITPLKEFDESVIGSKANDLNNLITLCKGCHAGIEHGDLELDV